MGVAQSSVAKALFLGEVEAGGVFPFPWIPEDEHETLALVVQSVKSFMTDYSSEFRNFDLTGAQPDEFILALKELGLFGLIIPQESGGLGMSSVSYARVLAEISKFDGSTALTVGAHSSIGMKGLLLFGSPAQKTRYLPVLATGEKIAAFCLTEPSSGSDAASIRTKVTRSENGGYILNGEKIWITNGAFADFFTVFARHDEKEGGDGSEPKLSAFIVEREWGGVVSGSKEDKMGIRASATTSVTFNNTQLPTDALLGAEGEGFRIAMSILNSGRTGLGGGCIGAMRRAISNATQYASDRSQFGKKLIEFPIIQDKLADMTMRCFATESVVQVVGHAIDSGFSDYSVEAAISKVYASESLWSVANEALQIAGGSGFMRDYPYEIIVRDSRINLIFEGTNEILRLYIALAGLRGVGDYLKELITGISRFASEPIRGFEILREYAARKIGSVLPVEERILVHIDPRLHQEGKVIVSFAARLGSVAERTVRKYRGSIVHEQLTLARLADAAIHLFVSLSVLSRITALLQKKGSSSTSETELLVSMARAFVQGAKRKVAASLRQLVRNEDDHKEVIARSVIERKGELWDILNDSITK